MANIYEMYGKQSESLSHLQDFYHYTMELLKQLKSGEVPLSALVVKDSGWEVKDISDV